MSVTAAKAPFLIGLQPLRQAKRQQGAKSVGRLVVLTRIVPRQERYRL